ncbi:MAG: CPBP family intramembrane metalloprotease [Actinobacteria bacterium]|nr:CPBP family intramembrane metalloprotease [Actinomycetota bacterium]
MAVDQPPDQQTAPAAPRWGLPDAALCFLAGFVASNLAVAVAAGVAGTDSLVFIASGLIGLWVGLVGSMVAVARSKGTGSLAADFGLRFERTHDLIGLPIGVAVQVVIVRVVYVPLTPFVHDLSERLEAPARDLSRQAGKGVGLFVLGVLVVAGAPVVEELFYRGMLLRAVRRRFGANVAIGASALVFAGAHFEAIQFPALLVLGLVLGWLAVRYDRLGPSIFAHAAFNAVTMAVLVATR